MTTRKLSDAQYRALYDAAGNDFVSTRRYSRNTLVALADRGLLEVFPPRNSRALVKYFLTDAGLAALKAVQA